MISHVASGCGELHSGVVAGRARKLSLYQTTEMGRVKVWLRRMSVRVAGGATGGEKVAKTSHEGTGVRHAVPGWVAGRAREGLLRQATGKRVRQGPTAGAVSLSHGGPQWAGPNE